VSVIMAVVGSVLAAGLALLKIALPIVLIFLVGRWLWCRVRKTDGGEKPGTSTPPPPTTEPGFDPGI
jgi:hypothetical protein